MEPDNKHNRSLSWRSILKPVLTLIVLGLAIHLILPQLASLQHSYQIIRNMLIWAVVIAVVMEVASYLGSGYLLRTLAEISGSSLSIIKGALITLAGASFGMVAGGMVGSSAVTYRWMKKEQVGTEAAVLAGTVPALFVDVALLAVSLIGLVHLLLVHQLSRLQVISFTATLALLVALSVLTVWGLRHREQLSMLAERIAHWMASLLRRKFDPDRIRNRLSRIFNAADLLLSGNWLGPLLGAFLNILFDMLALYFIFIAAGYPVTLGMLLTGYGLPLLLGRMAFIVPGGIGIIESAMTGIFAGMGVPAPTAVVVVLGYRLLSFWMPLVLGFPVILVLQHDPKT
jgi:uncharacterized protein (TIRG00374 family)